MKKANRLSGVTLVGISFVSPMLIMNRLVHEGILDRAGIYAGCVFTLLLPAFVAKRLLRERGEEDVEARLRWIKTGRRTMI